jgi:hypothetical protein
MFAMLPSHLLPHLSREHVVSILCRIVFDYAGELSMQLSFMSLLSVALQFL